MAVAPSPQYAYYCGNPAGYYPAVAQCLMPWQLVSLAAPPAAVVGTAPVVTAPAPVASSSSGIDKTTGGTVLGAVGGAVAGAQFGQGSGKIAAAVAGTLLGAFIGHEVGQSLDRADALAAQQAAQRAYSAPVGQTITWNSPDTGHSGTVTPTREGRDAQNNTCREFKQTVLIDGKQTEVTSTACRKSDGTWVMIGS
jgi:surface antigen